MYRNIKLICGAAIATGVYIGITGSALAVNAHGQNFPRYGQYDLEIKKTLERIEANVKDFKGSFEGYYGTIASDFTKPASTLANGTDKTIRDTLTAIFANSTNQTAIRAFSSTGQTLGMQYAPNHDRSLTQEDLVSFMTVPFSSKDCADCAVTVDTIRERNTTGLTYPYTKVSNSEILSAGSVGSGYENPTSTAPLNADSLLGPLQYAPASVTLTPTVNPNNPLASLYEQQETANIPRQVFGKNALSFIQHLVDKNRFRIYPKLPAKSTLTEEGAKERTTYLSELYNFAASVSVGLSNVYQMYTARIPTQKDGKSKLQAENEMVMSHMHEAWQNSIKQANPAKVQKEIAFLLAEMNYQLYQNRLIMERLLLTQSVVEINGAPRPQYREAYS
jgi:hypothetical protein